MIAVNKKVMVHAYKRNGWLYRVWEFPKVVSVSDNYICLSLENAKILTSDKQTKRFFKSINKKKSVWFFVKDKWYNIIATLQENNVVSYYVNIASPFIYEEDAIKYYDFDIDIKMRSDSFESYKVLDINEFNEHKVKFKYEKELVKKILISSIEFKDQKFRKKIMSELNYKTIESFLKNEK